MKPNIEDIEQGIEFISGDPAGDSDAFLSRATGEVFYRSDYVDEEIPLPSNIDDETKYLPLPNKRALDLGNVLVFNFVEERLPDEYSEIRAMFRKSGAYRRFSNWLDQQDLLDDWYRFRDETTKQTIIEWCKDNDAMCSSVGYAMRTFDLTVCTAYPTKLEQRIAGVQALLALHLRKQTKELTDE